MWEGCTCHVAKRPTWGSQCPVSAVWAPGPQVWWEESSHAFLTATEHRVCFDFCFPFNFFFWHNVLLWIPAYPGIREPPASASFALKSKLHATIPNLNMSFYCTSAFPGNGSGGQRAAMFFDDLWWTDRRQEGKSKTLQGFTTIWATSHSSWMHSVRAQYPNSSMLYCVAWVKWEHPTSESFSCKMGVSEGNCYN